MVSFERLPSVTVPPERRKRQRIAPFAALMLLAGPSNFVLYKVLFAAYGATGRNTNWVLALRRQSRGRQL